MYIGWNDLGMLQEWMLKDFKRVNGRQARRRKKEGKTEQNGHMC